MRQFSWRTGLAAIVLAGAPGIAEAWNANYQMCAAQVNWVWATTIDGVLDTDPGWANAFAFVPDPVEMGNTADVQMWSNADPAGPYLFYGFKVTNDPTYDDTDTLIMAFDAGGGSFHRVHVKPVHASGNGVQGSCPAGSFVPAAVEYWPGSNGGNGTVAWGTKQAFSDSTPSWMTACVRNSGATTLKTWTVEIRLKLGNADLPLPTNTDIGVYLNAYRVQTDQNGIQYQTQYTWPSQNGTIFDQIENTPKPDTWGVGRILAANNSACTGLYLSPLANKGAGAGIDTGHNGIISTTQPNLFSAVVYNDGPQATHVRATFFYFPWGSTNTWTPVPNGCAPQPCNNTNLGDTVPNGQKTIAMTTGWTASPNDAGAACARVDLSSDVGGTTFKQRSAFTNLTIAATSRAELKAKIDPGPAAQKLLVTTSQSVQYAYATGELAAIPAGKMTEQLTTVYRPFHITQKFVLYGNAKQYFLDPMPMFGVIAQHAVAARVQREFEARHGDILQPQYLLDPVWKELQGGPIEVITPRMLSETRVRVKREIAKINRERLKLPPEERKKLPPAADKFSPWARTTPALPAPPEIKRQRLQALRRANVVMGEINDRPKLGVWKTELPGIELKRKDNAFELDSREGKAIELPIVIEHP